MIEQETERTSAKPNWTIADLVDFEVLLGEDERLRRASDGGEALIEQTDRAIYRDHIKQLDPGGAGSLSPAERRRLIFRAWLDERRKLDERRNPAEARTLLGRSFAEVQTQARTLLAAVGVCCGFVVVTLHSYFGNLHVMSSGVPEPASVELSRGLRSAARFTAARGGVANPKHLAFGRPVGCATAIQTARPFDLETRDPTRVSRGRPSKAGGSRNATSRDGNNRGAHWGAPLIHQMAISTDDPILWPRFRSEHPPRHAGAVGRQ